MKETLSLSRARIFLTFLFFCYLIIPESVVYAQNQRMLRLVVPLYAEDVQLEPSFVAGLNQYLKDDDIIAVRGKPTLKKLIKEIKTGKIAVIRQSIADLEKDINFMHTEGIKFDYICYNPEAGGYSHTPEDEIEDLVLAIEKARSLAKKNKVGLIVVPGTANTLLWSGQEMARYADIFVIQFQRFQLLPADEFRKKVLELVGIVKKGNPNIPIIAQLSVNPPSGKWEKGTGKIYVSTTTDDLLAKIKAIEDIVDGVGFLLFGKDKGLERFTEFLEKYRNK